MKHYVGQIAWGYAFRETEDKEELRYIQTPVKGIFARTNKPNKGEDPTIPRRPDEYGTYFIPFKKNSNELAWSRAVATSSRAYADTYEDAVKGFNKKIDETIAHHMVLIKKREEHRIQV